MARKQLGNLLEECLSSLWGPDRAPAIPYIPRVCITRIKYQMFKYQILNQTESKIQALLMDTCEEMA